MSRNPNQGTGHGPHVAERPIAERELAALTENVKSAHAKLNGLDERVHHVEDDVHALQDEIKSGFDEMLDSLRSIEQYVRDLKLSQDLGDVRARLADLEKKLTLP